SCLADSLPSAVPSSSLPPRPTPTLFPYTTLFRSARREPHPRPRGDAAAGDLGPRAPHPQEGRPGHDSHRAGTGRAALGPRDARRSEEHTSELQSRFDLVCRLLLDKKNKKITENEI